MISCLFKNLLKTFSVQRICDRNARRIAHRNLIPYIKEKGDGGGGEEEEEEVFFEDFIENEINIAERSGHKGNVISRRQRERLQEAAERKALKEKIIKSKEKRYFAEKEPLMLTWAAMSQIKFLNEKDPDTWTLDALSHSFPVSRDTILRILRSKRIPYDEKEILRHDKIVYGNWLRLKIAIDSDSKGGPVDPEYRKLVQNEKLSKMVNASGIVSLPMPSTEQMFLTQKVIAERNSSKVKGEFSAILDSYERANQEFLSQMETAKSKMLQIEDKRTVQLLNDISQQSDENRIDGGASEFSGDIDDIDTGSDIGRDEWKGKTGELIRQYRQEPDMDDFRDGGGFATEGVEDFEHWKQQSGFEATTSDRNASGAKKFIEMNRLTFSDYKKQTRSKNRKPRHIQRNSSHKGNNEFKYDRENSVNDEENDKNLSGNLEDINLVERKPRKKPLALKQIGNEFYSADGELMYKI